MSDPSHPHPRKKSRWSLPENDPWSARFAEVLLDQLDLFPGAHVLDVACGSGIPAFYIADQVGHEGWVLGVDASYGQLARAMAIKGQELPWLTFEQMDLKSTPDSMPTFDRITGNLSFMFFRPDRFTALKNLLRHLKPGGQIVLSFPSLGTFDSLWQHVDKAMVAQGLNGERVKFHEYLEERPSAKDATNWLEQLGMENVKSSEWPLEIETGPGAEFLYHPLLRGGFLDDVYECFEDAGRANAFMNGIADELDQFTPLLALRCAFSGWKPGEAK